MNKDLIVVVGIICITIIEGIALLKGLNGVLLTATIATIVGLAGWRIPTKE